MSFCEQDDRVPSSSVHNYSLLQRTSELDRHVGPPLSLAEHVEEGVGALEPPKEDHGQGEEDAASED